MFDFATNTEHAITIPSGKVLLEGILHIPKNATGAVIFAHGSGSSRLSPRNQYIARILQKSKLVTLLFDLLTSQEDAIDERTREFRFDIKLLADRLLSATDWIKEIPEINTLPIGYFGASTGGGSALVAAAQKQDVVKAVVSRGGRPDLAGPYLPEVTAATLLLVGGEDDVVIELNKQAYAQLTCVKKLEIIPGATHLFEEPGKLEEVSRLADAWFKNYLI